MSVLYENIKYVCKKNGVRISDIEHPMKKGFISRHERRGDILSLPIWVLIKVSNTCKVPVGDLLEKDLKAEGQLAEVRNQIEQLKTREKELMEGKA